MSKVRPHKIDPQEKKMAVENFFEVVLKMKTKNEIIDFFAGLFTASEMLMVSRRIQVAQMIMDEKTYDEIREKLGVGYDTITKTERWLRSDNEKYNLWIQNKLKNNIGKSVSKNIKNEINYGSILDKYPQHRFLKDIVGKILNS